MTPRDYYEVLEVSRQATDGDIKKAFRRLAMKHHPDRNNGDHESAEKFKEAKEAYDVLSDSQKRSVYDRFGHAGLEGGARGGAQGFGFGDIFEDIFGDIFGAARGRSGNGQSRSRHEEGADLQYQLEISLEEAALGTQVEIQVPTYINCESCEGNGAKKGTKPSTCNDCEGAGQIRIQQGFFSIQQTCPRCRGQGQVIQSPCEACHGQGRVKNRKKLSVKIPAGVDSGDRIRLSGEGEAGFQGGHAGDLYILIQLRPHSLFERQGDDLYCDVPIDLATAALGGELDVPTLSGRVQLKIPPETQNGKVLRIRGKGIHSVRSKDVGDLLCRIVVETPINLTQEQKEWLRLFAESLQNSGTKHTPKRTSWFAGVKKFFEDMKF